MASSTHYGKKQSFAYSSTGWGGNCHQSAAGWLLVNHAWIHWEWHLFKSSMRLVTGYHRNTVIFPKLVHLVEVEHTSKRFSSGFKTSDGARLGLGIVLPLAAAKMDPQKRGLAFSSQAAYSYPMLLTSFHHPMWSWCHGESNENIYLSFWRGRPTWTSSQSSSLYSLENPHASVSERGVLWELK